MLRELDEAGARLRTTPRPGDNLEAEVAAAGAAGWSGARRRTADRLGGFDISGLGQNVDCKAPMLLDISPGFVEDLHVAAAVDQVLRTIDARPGHARIADGTRRPVIPEADGVFWAAHGESGTTTVRSFAVHDLLAKGVTLIVNNLTPRMGGSLRDFINDLDRTLGLDAQVNLYLSEREAPGFGRHWDDHDVLVLQAMGRKHWTLFAPTALSPRIGATPPREFGSPVFSTILEPGSALFIPRGWGHEVSGFEDDLSIHYTVGMRPPTGHEVLESALALVLASDLASLATPAQVTEESRRFDRAMLEHAVGQHRSRIFTTPRNGVVEIYQAARTGFEGQAFVAPLPGGPVYVDSPERRPGTIGFAAGGYLLEAEPRGCDLLVDLFSGRPVVISGTDGPEQTAVVLGLARRGLVDMVEASASDVTGPASAA